MLAPRINLLVVDDDAALRLSLSMVLEAIGYKVRTAEDGFAALAEIRNGLPDVLLSDLNMPGMSGFELLSVVRRRFPTIRVIAMSGGLSGDGIPTGIAADACHRKGCNLDSLLSTLEAMTRADQPVVQRDREVSPMWIPRIGQDETGNVYITLTCPECLRTFPQILGEGVALIHEADCVHCATHVPYALVRQSEAQPDGFTMGVTNTKQALLSL
jgi:CheY-like chemotaxis protein